VSPVIELLKARRARGSRRPHGDGVSIALAVEGGAMRGVISAGMVSALETLGLADAFDAVYGSSAGAINAAYFLAGQARLGTTLYYDNINPRRFIDLGRARRGRPIVNLDYLLNDVARRAKPLDASRVIAAASPLAVVATDVDRQTSHALRAFRDPSDLFAALRASATMPVLAGDPLTHLGRRYLDASLSEPIPVPTAERDGHTHVLVLLTRGPGIAPQPSALDRWFVAPRLRRVSASLAAQYLTRSVPYAALMQQIEAGTGPLGRAIVSAIRVADFRVSRLERRGAVLEAGARRGYDQVITAFAP
jgi:predicted patatin/cPLA2 family phospholipase